MTCILYDNDNVTLSWDSTSVEEHHINESSHQYSYGSSHFLCATIRYTSWRYDRQFAFHIQTCITEIVRSCAEYHKLDLVQTKSNIIHHIELHKLKCNVHPLDGIARRCKDLKD